MNRANKAISLAVCLMGAALAGCSDRYEEGYAAGYAVAAAAVRKQVSAECEERVTATQQPPTRQRYSYEAPSYVTTEVCGGAGVNVNGKHVPAGKTGCVRVYSDGRTERY